MNNDPVEGVDPFGLVEFHFRNSPGPPPPRLGSGPWGAQKPDADDKILHARLKRLVPFVALKYPKAAGLFGRYLANHGKPYVVPMANLLTEDAAARRFYYLYLNEAMDFAETRNASTRFVSDWLLGFTSDPDWLRAIGSYHVYLKADVTLTDDGYIMDLLYVFYDWYDWDGWNKSFQLPGLSERYPDAVFGRLHEVGLAREYPMYGMYKTRITWSKGQRFDESGKLKAADGTPLPEPNRPIRSGPHLHEL